MSEWIKFNGTKKQISEIKSNQEGFIAKLKNGYIIFNPQEYEFIENDYSTIECYFIVKADKEIFWFEHYGKTFIGEDLEYHALFFRGKYFATIHKVDTNELQFYVRYLEKSKGYFSDGFKNIDKTKSYVESLAIKSTNKYK